MFPFRVGEVGLTGGSIASGGLGDSSLEFTGGGDVLEIGSSSDINTGNITEKSISWNHVTLTYDSVAGEIKLHLNGAAALTGTAMALTGHNRATMGASREGSRFQLGSSFINSNSQHAYTGLIDDVRVYKRALTDEEAAQLAAATPM